MTPNPIQRAALARRFEAAEDLVRACQRTREASRYDRATLLDQQSVHAAELVYDAATSAARAVSAA